MATVQGVIDSSGTVIRKKGNFTVVTAFSGQITVDITGRTVRDDIILATPWSNVGDALGGSHIAAIVGFPQPGYILFEVSPPFGVSFRVET